MARPMTAQALIQQALDRLFDPWGLAMAGGAVILVAVTGAASLRILRRFPDFPAKREMEWGAKWFWLLFLLLIAASYASTYICLTRTRYLVSGAIVGKLVLDTAALAGLVVLRRQASGYSLWAVALGARLRGRRVDFTQWVESERKAQRKWRYRVGVAALAALIVLADCYVVLAFTYPIDAEYSGRIEGEKHASAVRQLVARELDSAAIQSVGAYGPLPDLKLDEGGELATAERSVRRILHVGGGARPTSPPAYHLFVHVGDQTDEAAARDILQRVRRILHSAGEIRPWIIWVGNRDAGIAVRGGYPDDAAVAGELSACLDRGRE